MTATRLKVGLLFGGRSAEHDVSKLSAANVLSALDPARYEVVPIGIRRDGRWVLLDAGSGEGGLPAIPQGGPEVALLPGAKAACFIPGEPRRREMPSRRASTCSSRSCMDRTARMARCR